MAGFARRIGRTAVRRIVIASASGWPSHCSSSGRPPCRLRRDRRKRDSHPRQRRLHIGRLQPRGVVLHHEALLARGDGYGPDAVHRVKVRQTAQHRSIQRPRQTESNFHLSHRTFSLTAMAPGPCTTSLIPCLTATNPHPPVLAGGVGLWPATSAFLPTCGAGCRQGRRHGRLEAHSTGPPNWLRLCCSAGRPRVIRLAPTA